MPTATTAPLILLVFFLWYRTRGSVLSIVLFTSIFDAASALNFGSLGLSPPLFSLALCLVAKLMRGHRPIRFITGINRASLYLLVAFIGYSVVTGLFYPLIFAGVTVIHSSNVAPLAWSIFNFTQICYLLASVLLYVLTVSSSREDLQKALDWYVRACVLSAVIGVYQLANAVLHVPYPDSILYSNPSYVVYRAYMINGMWRLNATFPEASQFAIYTVVAIGLLGWTITNRGISILRAVSLVLMVVMLIMTESSLGYICLTYTLILGLSLYAYQIWKRKGVAAAHVLLGITIIAGGTITLAESLAVSRTALKLVRTTLFDKQNSDSYRDRTATHSAALDTLSHTYYLGAGWGSVRASGLAFTLLGNVGLFGFCLFVAFCGSLVLPLFGNSRMFERRCHDLYGQSMFALGIMLVGLVVAGAEPVQPILWVLFGVATVGRASVPFSADRTTCRFSKLLTTHVPQLQPSLESHGG